MQDLKREERIMGIKANKKTIPVAVAAASMLALSACSGGTDVQSPGTESGGAGAASLRVVDYYFNEPDQQFYQEILDKCSGEVGVTLEREVIPGDELVSKILQMSSSRTLPDILMVDSPDLPQIAASGALTPIDELGLTAEGEAQGIIDAATYEGKVYGLQPVANSIGLFYNVDMLEEAGVKPPTTWEELREASKTLTEGSRYGLAITAKADYEGAWTFLPFMWSNGINEDDLKQPGMVEALQYWKELFTNESISESALNWTQADTNEQFMEGNAAMMINGPWQIPLLNEKEGLNWGVVEIPVPKAGDTSIAPLGGELWAVPRSEDSDKQALAAEVIQCINEDQNQLDLAVKRQTVPSKPALHADFAEQAPDMQIFSGIVQNARSRTAILGEEWPKTGVEIYTAFQSVLVGDKTPEQAVEAITQ